MSVFTADLEAKRLELLHELVAKAASLGVLLDPKFQMGTADLQSQEVQAAARKLGREARDRSRQRARSITRSAFFRALRGGSRCTRIALLDRLAPGNVPPGGFFGTQAAVRVGRPVVEFELPETEGDALGIRVL